MKLKFQESEIVLHANNYVSQQNELEKVKENELIALRNTVQRAGHLTKAQMRLIAMWKSPRSAHHIENNTDGFIKEITSFALKCEDRRARIESLTLLDGVLWPTASVVLHLFHAEPHPILDFRALWSISVEVPSQYDFEFWECYILFCRKIASCNKVDMRVLDRALWQYSKDNQP